MKGKLEGESPEPNSALPHSLLPRSRLASISARSASLPHTLLLNSSSYGSILAFSPHQWSFYLFPFGGGLVLPHSC